MTRNTLKTIACVSMLVDHIGYILLPEAAFLRYIGRLAMPIFAFFIGEGCLYTRNRKKYFTRIFGLGVVCQLFYIGEYLFTKAVIHFISTYFSPFRHRLCFARCLLMRQVKKQREKPARQAFCSADCFSGSGCCAALVKRGLSPLNSITASAELYCPFLRQ